MLEPVYINLMVDPYQHRFTGLKNDSEWRKCLVYNGKQIVKSFLLLLQSVLLLLRRLSSHVT